MSYMAATASQFKPIDFRTRFPALDGIRALAIMLVFVEHYGGGSHGGAVLQTINDLRRRGWIGVNIFFVLSGFLIMGILFDTRHDSKFFRRFFARRSLRIFPVYYLVFAILVALTPVFHYEWRWLHLTFLIYLDNLFGNYDFSLYDLLSANHPYAEVFIGHFWSLCVEEQFYLFCPLAVWVIRDRVKLLWAAGSFYMLALLLRLAMCHYLPAPLAEQWVARTLPFRMDDLLIGGILALLLRGPRADLWQRNTKWFLLAGTAATLAIFVLSPAYDSPWLLTVGYTFIGLASAGLIGTALRAGSSSFRLFSLGPLSLLGKYSYGFYVYHVLFRWAWIQFLVFVSARTHSMALGGIIALGLNFAVTFLVAKLSYDLYEKRFLKFKSHFAYDSEAVALKQHV